MTSTAIDPISRALGLGALAFGVAGILAPTTLRRAYGLSESGPALTYMSRMWGTRTAALGALALSSTSSDERKRFALAAAAMNGLDALAVATTDGIPRSTRLMAGLTSAGFAAMGAYGVGQVG